MSCNDSVGSPAAGADLRVRPCCQFAVMSRSLWLQEQGLDTVDANRALGLPDDCREYTSVRNILRDLGVKSIKLMVRCSGNANGDAIGWRLADIDLRAERRQCTGGGSEACTCGVYSCAAWAWQALVCSW